VCEGERERACVYHSHSHTHTHTHTLTHTNTHTCIYIYVVGYVLLYMKQHSYYTDTHSLCLSLSLCTQKEARQLMEELGFISFDDNPRISFSSMRTPKGQHRKEHKTNVPTPIHTHIHTHTHTNWDKTKTKFVGMLITCENINVFRQFLHTHIHTHTHTHTNIHTHTHILSSLNIGLSLFLFRANAFFCCSFLLIIINNINNTINNINNKKNTNI